MSKKRFKIAVSCFFGIQFFLLSFSIFGQSSRTAWSRADSLGTGVNLEHWLEEYWNPNYPDMNYIKEADISLIKSLNFDHIRLSVDFGKWEDTLYPYNVNPGIFAIIDTVLAWCGKYDLKLIIDDHHGRIEQVGVYVESPRLIAAWKQIAARFKNTNPSKVFFELYNEPLFDKNDWQLLSQKLADTIHSISPEHTLIIGPTKGNTVYGLLDNYVPVNDTNVIYTFHFYEPALFTHQGALWAGAYFHITGYPFPYDSLMMPQKDSTITSDFFGSIQYDNYPTMAISSWIKYILGEVKNWSLQHNVPIECGELGTYYQSQHNYKLNWLKTITCTLDSLGIPWAHWGFKHAENTFGFIKGALPDNDSIIPGFFNSLCMTQPFLLGTDELPVKKESELKIYPNPANSILFIDDKFNHFNNSKITVFSIDGRVVLESIYSQKKLNIEKLPSGLYYGKISNSEFKSFFKFIVIH